MGGGLQYQWFKGSAPVEAGTNAVLSYSPAVANNAGRYSVIISNSFGSVTSQVATVTVIVPPAGSYDELIVNAQPTSWWRFDESDHFHHAAALGTGQRVDLVHPLDEHRPRLAGPAVNRNRWGVYGRGGGGLFRGGGRLGLLPPQAAGLVRVPAATNLRSVPANQVRALRWNKLRELAQEVQRVEDQFILISQPLQMKSSLLVTLAKDDHRHTIQYQEGTTSRQFFFLGGINRDTMMGFFKLLRV